MPTAAVADRPSPATRSFGPSLARASMAPGGLVSPGGAGGGLRVGGALLQDGGLLPVDVFVHDEQPQPTSVAESDPRPATDSQ
jgi:hypothetical protein